MDIRYLELYVVYNTVVYRTVSTNDVFEGVFGLFGHPTFVNVDASCPIDFGRLSTC